MKILSALLLSLLVTACSHPLEIVGEGDIVSSTGNNDCSLEEQPCANVVAGDYNVTYTAEPHAGWSFAGWEGCGGQFPDCSINVPGTVVDQHWGQVMPPLRATFSKQFARKKVLVLFDTSGSMNVIAQEGGSKPGYDPAESYISAHASDRVYWSTNGSPPPTDTDQWFSLGSNRCAESIAPLASVGFFQTRARYWREAAAAGWEALDADVPNPLHVDCEADVLRAGNAGNGSTPDGFPKTPDSPDAPNSEAYTYVLGASDLDWSNNGYTFYSAHRMDYAHDVSIVTPEQTRLQVAQSAVNQLIKSNTSIDFGLSVFNHNTYGFRRGWCEHGSGTLYNGWPCTSVSHRRTGLDTDLDNGGRIIHAIIEGMTDTDRSNLAGPSGIVNGINANGNSPLVESSYEAYRYLAGLPEVYGAQQDDSNDLPWLGGDAHIDTPDPDPRAYVDNTSTYKQPSSDCGYTYIILMTDGAPTRDDDANAAIEALTGEVCDDYDTGDIDSLGNPILRKSCLPALTNHMATADLDQNPDNGDQFAITYTVAITTPQQSLAEAATAENGYFVANDATELIAALRGAVADILVTPPAYCE